MELSLLLISRATSSFLYLSLSFSLSLSIGFRQKPFLKDEVCIIGSDDNPFKVEDRRNNLFARSTMDRKDAFNPFAALREESILAWRNNAETLYVQRIPFNGSTVLSSEN